MQKRRITVTVDEDVYEAAATAVAEGRAESVSGWVNEALSDHRDAEARRLAMAEAIAAYERESGRIITSEDIVATEGRDREAAAAVRARRRHAG